MTASSKPVPKERDIVPQTKPTSTDCCCCCFCCYRSVVFRGGLLCMQGTHKSSEKPECVPDLKAIFPPGGRDRKSLRNEQSPKINSPKKWRGVCPLFFSPSSPTVITGGVRSGTRWHGVQKQGVCIVVSLCCDTGSRTLCGVDHGLGMPGKPVWSCQGLWVLLGYHFDTWCPCDLRFFLFGFWLGGTTLWTTTVRLYNQQKLVCFAVWCFGSIWEICLQYSGRRGTFVSIFGDAFAWI